MDLWQSGLRVGVIDAVADRMLQGLAALLSLEPYYFPLVETSVESIGFRWVNLIDGPRVRIEIWYSVVEDDLTVFLESVEVIDRY